MTWTAKAFPTPRQWLIWALSRAVVLASSVSAIDLGMLLGDPGLIWSWANDAPIAGALQRLDEYPGVVRLVLSVAEATPSVPAFAMMWMAVLLAIDATLLVILDQEDARAGWWWVAVGAALGPVVWLRLDLLVGLLVLGAVLLRTTRPALSGSLLAVAILMKLWPLALIPLLLVGPRPYRFVAGLGTVVAVGMALDLLIYGPESLVTPWLYQGERGIHVESTWALPALWAAALGDSSIESVNAYRSYQVGDKPLSVSVLGLLITVAAGLVGAWVVARANSRDSRLVAAAAVTAVIVSANSVFSPQYILWFAPLTLVVWARRPRIGALPALLLGIAALTQVIWPYNYSALLDFEPWAVVVLTIRNALMIGLAVVLSWHALRLARPGAAAPPAVATHPGRTAPATGIE